MTLDEYLAEQKELNAAWATIVRLNWSRSLHSKLLTSRDFMAAKLDERWEAERKGT